MKRVFSSPDLIQATQLRDVLEREGIACVLRNDILAGLAPEVPFTEAFPEVWVQNDADLARAETIKNDWRKGVAQTTDTWTCSNCGEEIEGQFSSCWKCGTPRRETAVV